MSIVSYITIQVFSSHCQLICPHGFITSPNVAQTHSVMCVTYQTSFPADDDLSHVNSANSNPEVTACVSLARASAISHACYQSQLGLKQWQGQVRVNCSLNHIEIYDFSNILQ